MKFVQKWGILLLNFSVYLDCITTTIPSTSQKTSNTNVLTNSTSIITTTITPNQKFVNGECYATYSNECDIFNQTLTLDQCNNSVINFPQYFLVCIESCAPFYYVQSDIMNANICFDVCSANGKNYSAINRHVFYLINPFRFSSIFIFYLQIIKKLPLAITSI